MPAVLDPHRVISDRIRASQREGALTAAAILKFTPERIGDERVGDWLSRIGHGTIREATVAGWLERAGVNPWRPGRELSVRQRYALAGLLLRFAQGDRTRRTGWER